MPHHARTTHIQHNQPRSIHLTLCIHLFRLPSHPFSASHPRPPFHRHPPSSLWCNSHLSAVMKYLRVHSAFFTYLCTGCTENSGTGGIEGESSRGKICGDGRTSTARAISGIFPLNGNILPDTGCTLYSDHTLNGTVIFDDKSKG